MFFPSIKAANKDNVSGFIHVILKDQAEWILKKYKNIIFEQIINHWNS